TSMSNKVRELEQQAEQMIDRQHQLTLELSLSESHRRQAEAVIDSITDPILGVDAFGQLNLINPAAAALFKADRATSLRKDLSDVINDEGIIRSIAQARESHSRSATRKVEHAVGDEFFALSLSALSGPAKGAEGNDTHGVVAAFRNITLERQAAR